MCGGGGGMGRGGGPIPLPPTQGGEGKSCSQHIVLCYLSMSTCKGVKIYLTSQGTSITKHDNSLADTVTKRRNDID